MLTFCFTVNLDRHVACRGREVTVAMVSEGGKSFEVLGEGLFQIHAHDLTLQYTLDIDEKGTAPSFDHRGDGWECVSIHLPPVYCVAIAPMR